MMEQQELYPNTRILRLSELNSAIRGALEFSFPDTLWVVAEISEIRSNTRNHCYLELAERSDDKTVAQIKATIWAYTFKTVSSKFERTTGENLKQGMKVLLQVSVAFHEVYGLSLNVIDIDPTYSLGEMARRKREIIERLTKEGLMNLNKRIDLPLVPQRIAVVSSSTAAGYGDFINHLDNNPYGYKIFHTLYHATVQGHGAETSIISALRALKRDKDRYDAVVIIRGGGSRMDLSCFDAYPVASDVARLPLPVITGIGHERDDTVTDMVSHTRLKTPTAVAAFLLGGMAGFEDRLLDAQRKIARRTAAVLKEEAHEFELITNRFRHALKDTLQTEANRVEIVFHQLIHTSTQTIEANKNLLNMAIRSMSTSLKVLLHRQDERLGNFDRAIRLLDPANVLRRGYSITYHKGKPVKDSSVLRDGDTIETRVYAGGIKSRVEGLDVKE